MSARSRRALAALSLSFASACRSPAPPAPPPPLAPPGVRAELAHHFGSLLSGPLPPGEAVLAAPTGEAALAGGARAVRVRIVLVERSGGEDPTALPDLEPLASHAALVLGARAADPLLPTTRAAAGGHVARGAAAERWEAAVAAGALGRSRVLVDGRAALYEGTSVRSSAGLDAEIPDPENFLGERPERGPVRQSVGLAFSSEASGGAVSAALAIATLVDGEAREELVLFDAPLEPGMPLAVLVPSPFHGGGARYVACFAELGDDPSERELELARADLAASAESRTAQTARPAPAELQHERAVQALAAVRPGAEARATLVRLSEAGGASLATDLALVAGEATFEAFVEAVAAERDAAAAPRDLDEAAWLLERSAWRVLARATLEVEVPLELESLLLRHAGEAGRYAGAIEDHLQASASVAELEERLVAENTSLLEDPSPASRVRAHDWLALRGRAPAGYEPLASREERRAALDEARRGTARE